MTEVTRAEFEQTRRMTQENDRRIACLNTEFAVINTKLTAILWLLGAIGTALIAALARLVFGVGS